MIRTHVAMLALLLTAWLSIGLSGCEPAPPPPKPIRPVLSQVVDPRPYWREASYAGEVRARYETALGFRIRGKIIARLVDVGDQVDQGQALAKVDPEDYQLRLLEAEAALAAARAERDKAATDQRRYATLVKKKVVSQAKYNDYRNALTVAEARLRQAQAELAVTRNQTEYTTLEADHAGVITAIEAEVGQVVAAGQTVMRLALSGDKEVVIAVAENRLAELREAGEVRITLWANPDRGYRGKVREISPGADPVTRTYSAKVTLLDAGPEVQLGMTATVTVRRRLAGDVVRLPLGAIYQKDGRPAVWIVDPGDNQVRLQDVVIAEYLHDAVDITSGLEPGQRVVTAGVHKLVPGQKVRIAAITQLPNRGSKGVRYKLPIDHYSRPSREHHR